MKRSISESLLQSPAARPRAEPFEITDTKLQGFTLRVQPSGQRSFIVRIGRSRRYTIGRAGQMTAEEARDQAVQVLANVKRGVPTWSGIRAESLTLGEFVDGDYASWVLANRRTGQRSLARLRWCFDEWWRTPLDHITPELIERWKLRRLKAGVSPSTVHRDIAALSAVFTRAVRTFRKIADNPVRLVDKPRLDRSPKVRFLSNAEEARLRGALAERDREFQARRASANSWRRQREYDELPTLPYHGDHLTAAVLLSMNTGLRQGELLSLRWSDVDLHERLLTVHGGDTKTGHTRHVPLNAEASKILAQWREQSSSGERVFPVDTSFKTAWAALLRRANIRDFRWHDLRHHFASRLVQAGVPLNTVRELLGHGSMQMTLRYAHLAPDQRREAVERLSPCATF